MRRGNSERNQVLCTTVALMLSMTHLTGYPNNQESIGGERRNTSETSAEPNLFVTNLNSLLRPPDHATPSTEIIPPTFLGNSTGL